MDRPAYRRVLLKLSGEALTGKSSFAIDPEVVEGLASHIRKTGKGLSALVATVGALACARRRVLIMTPYFIPDRPLLSAITTTALRGVDVRWIYRFSFVLAMLVITMGGVLFAMAYGFDLTMAWTMAIIGFAIMIVGGPGSVLGSVVIGMIFGFTQAIVSLFASPTLASFSYLIVMLIILLVKPSGLFAR